MIRRVLLATVVGGLLSFAWGIASEMTLGLTQKSLHGLPPGSHVLDTVSNEIKDPGFYMFPGGPESMKGTQAEQQVAMDKMHKEYATGPHGILVVSPPEELNFQATVVKQLEAEIATALVGAILLALAAGALRSYGQRVLFMALLGLFGSLSIIVPYVIWYGFPTNYAVSIFVDEVVGWGIAGLAMGAIVRRRA